jgi:hypothetical protein
MMPAESIPLAAQPSQISPTTLGFDLRPALRERLAEAESRKHILQCGRRELDSELEQLNQHIETLQDMVRYEALRLGDFESDETYISDMSLLTEPLSNAAQQFIRNGESREAFFQRILQIGYDFQGKNPNLALWRAWRNAEKREGIASRR